MRSNCGFALEYRDQSGGFHSMPCWFVVGCPHQPQTHYYVAIWAISNKHGDRRFLAGPFETHAKAREATYQWYLVDEDLYTEILPVQYCRWPVRHPLPIEE